MSDVVLESVWKTYPGEVHAVRGINLGVDDGQFVVLVGGSGCGKSTTLRMIAGLETVTHGEVRIGGRVVNNLAPKDRDIAMVFQNYALYPHMSVYDNMALGLKMRKVDKAEIRSRVADAAELLGLTDYLNRKPRALSGGQRQRVAVGRAIVREPRCFLFDEPLSNLDAKLRTSTRAELKQLHKRLGATMIYVTHDQEEAMTLADRICVMADGEIQQIASPLEIYRIPANRFVAGFMGTPAMNFIKGTLGTRSDSTAVFRAATAAGADALEFPLTSEQSARFEAAGAASMTLGIRPQAFTESRPSGRCALPMQLEASVVIVEPLGDQMDVGVSIGPHQLRARVAVRPGISTGDRIRLWLDAADCHFFAPGDRGCRL